MNAFFVAISLKRQVYIDPNGGVQLVTWHANKRSSFVAFYASVDFYEGDKCSEQIYFKMHLNNSNVWTHGRTF